MGNNSCMISNRPSYSLSVDINISSWTKMHNLYDHLGSDLKTHSSFSTSQNTIIIQYQNEWRQIRFMSELEKINKNKIQAYFDVSKENSKYTVFNNICHYDGLGENSSVWKVIDDKDTLRLNDVIKLGRFRFKLVDMITETLDKEQKEVETESQNSCKICYSNMESVNNPLIAPCDCSGTMKYIHLDCLRDWIAKVSKITSTQHVAQIPTKQFNCQLCGKVYEPIVTHEGKMFCILYNNTVIKPPYIQLNLLEKNTNSSKASYVVSFSSLDTIKIGRANSCQIQPKQDISISRIHAQLSLKNNVLSIKNLSSKFGTLKLLKQPQQLFNMSITQKYQISNNLIQIQTRSIPNQNKNKNKNKNNKQDQNNQMKSIRQSLVGIKLNQNNDDSKFYSFEEFPSSEIRVFAFY